MTFQLNSPYFFVFFISSPSTQRVPLVAPWFFFNVLRGVSQLFCWKILLGSGNMCSPLGFPTKGIGIFRSWTLIGWVTKVTVKIQLKDYIQSLIIPLLRIPLLGHEGLSDERKIPTNPLKFICLPLHLRPFWGCLIRTHMGMTETSLQTKHYIHHP